MTLRTPALLLALAVAAARPALAQEADRRSAAEIRAFYGMLNAPWEPQDPGVLGRFDTPVGRLWFAPWRMASERGTWTGSWTEPDGKVMIAGSYFAKWRQLNGTWFVESETNVPDRCVGSSYCGLVP